MSRRVALRWEGRAVEAEVQLRPPHAALLRDGRRFEAEVKRDGGAVEIRRGGGTVRCVVASGPRAIWVAFEGRTYVLERVQREAERADASEDSGEVRAPMTGRVVRVAARVEAAVREGDPLVTIEAMKMEFRLTAPADGAVSEVLCAEGDQVELGQLLLRLLPAPSPDGEGAP